MKRFFLSKFALSLLLSNLCALGLLGEAERSTRDVVAHEDTVSESYSSRFYQDLSDEYKEAFEHVVRHHTEVSLDVAMRAIGMLEKMIALSGNDEEKAACCTRLSLYSTAVHNYLKAVISTRVVHDGIMVPIFNCCTPRDAYFREVVTNLLTVTGNATVAGSLTVSGGLVVTGTQLLQNLLVTGTTTTGSLVVRSNEVVAGNASIGGNVFIGGTLTVTGSSTLNNPLGITSTSASTALAINESGGTGVALAVTGNASQPAIGVSQGTGQSAIQVGAGTVAAPSYSFTGNAGTGLYLPAANRFALGAAGVNKVNYDGTSVLVSSLYRFSASRSGDQVIPAGTSATVIFNNPLVASASYNTTTGVFTAPVTGVYLIVFNVYVTSAAATPDNIIARIRLNGVQVLVAASQIPVAASANLGASLFYALTAGDTIDINATATVSGNLTVVGGSQTSAFGVHLISVS